MKAFTRRDFIFGATSSSFALSMRAGIGTNLAKQSLNTGSAADVEEDLKEIAQRVSVDTSGLDGISNLIQVIDGLRDEVSTLKARITALEGEELPDYYESDLYSISSRCMDILSLNPRCVPSVLQFAFVTDFHATVYNQQFHTRALLNKVFATTNCDVFVNGGDVVDGKLDDGSHPSEAEFAYQIKKYSSWLIPDLCSLALFAAGNHDCGASWNPTGDALIDQETLSRHSVIRRSAGSAVFDPNGKCQYYVDDSYHKVRWIVTNYGNGSNIGDWDSEGLHGVVGESEANLCAFVGHALGAMERDWSAIVINHIILNGLANKTAQALEDICDAYNDRRVYQSDDYKRDFADGAGNVVCILGGHTHFDWTYNTSSGIPVIIVTTDNCAGQCVYDDVLGKLYRDESIRMPGTPQEQAFDVFTIDFEAKTIRTIRIGFGDDRQWKYG